MNDKISKEQVWLQIFCSVLAASCQNHPDPHNAASFNAYKAFDDARNVADKTYIKAQEAMRRLI